MIPDLWATIPSWLSVNRLQSIGSTIFVSQCQHHKVRSHSLSFGLLFFVGLVSLWLGVEKYESVTVAITKSQWNFLPEMYGWCRWICTNGLVPMDGPTDFEYNDNNSWPSLKYQHWQLGIFL
jgi:hypothetical protein